MNVKSLLKITLVGAGNILNAALGFLFIAVVAKSLSLEDFGKYALLTGLVVSVAKLTDFGTNSLFVAQSITRNEHLISKFLSLKMLLLTIAFPISYLILASFKLTTFQIVVTFFLGLLAYAANFALFGFFQKLENFTAAVLLNSIPAIIKGIFAGLVLAGAVELTFVNFFLVFVGSIFPSLLLFFFLPKGFYEFKFSLHGIKSLFKETFPAGTSQLISEGWSSVANSIAKIAQGYVDVGLYAVADKISSIFSLVSLSIFTVLLPKNAKNKKSEHQFDFKETFLLSILILLISAVAITFAKTLVPLLFGSKFTGAIALINVMIIASALTAMHSFMENYFYIEGKTKTLLYISVTKLAVFLGFSFLLVPKYDLIGMIYAQLVAAVVALSVTVVAMNHHKKTIFVKKTLL